MVGSAARWTNGGTITVVLSGVPDDDAAGAALVAGAGGRVVVQDPSDAIFDSMPRATLAAAPAPRRSPRPSWVGKELGAMAEVRPRQAPCSAFWRGLPADRLGILR
jgi:hypothetical protein